MNASQVNFLFNPELVDGDVVTNDNGAMKKNTVENPVGAIIVAQLKQLKKTQNWLAEQCGVSNTAVHKWIHTGQIARENAVAAALALKLSVDQLLGQEAKAPQAAEFALTWVSSAEQELLTNYRQSTEMGREMIEISARGAPKDPAFTNKA